MNTNFWARTLSRTLSFFLLLERATPSEMDGIEIRYRRIPLTTKPVSSYSPIFGGLFPRPNSLSYRRCIYLSFASDDSVPGWGA